MSSSVVTFREDLLQPRRIYKFVGSHLNYWDGVEWHWVNQNVPPGAIVEGSAGALTYFRFSRHIFAFYLNQSGGDFGSGSGELWLNYWDGTQWSWANNGTPKANPIYVVGPPTVVTFPRSNHQRIYAFVVLEGSLRVNYWNGSQWKWVNLGHHPDWPVVASNVQAITYFDGSDQRIYIFSIGGPGHLSACYWNGEQWTWADLGPPPGTTFDWTPAIFERGPGVVTHSDGGTQWIYVFAWGANGHLITNYWNGSQWTWADHGAPPGGSPSTSFTLPTTPEVISYLHQGVRRIYVFVESGGHLFMNYWNGIEWKWVDHGTPPGSTIKEGRRIAAVTYSDLFPQERRIHVFVEATNGHHYRRYWSGSQWTWVDQGEP